MPTVQFTRLTRTTTDVGPVLLGITTLDGRSVAAVVTKHSLDDYAWSIAGDLRDSGIRGYKSEASAIGGLMDGLDRLLAGGRRTFGWTEGDRVPTRDESIMAAGEVCNPEDVWPGDGPDEWRDDVPRVGPMDPERAAAFERIAQQDGRISNLIDRIEALESAPFTPEIRYGSAKDLAQIRAVRRRWWRFGR